MSRKVVRLTLDHLAELDRAVPHLPVLGARPGQPRPGRDGRRPPRRRPGSPQVLRDWGSCGRVVLVDDAAGRLRDLRARGVPAGRRRRSRPRRSRPTRCCSPRRGSHPAARRRRARPDADPGHGARPDQARRDQGRRGVRRHPRARAAGQLRGAGGLPGQRRASRPSGRTARTPRMRMDLRAALTWQGRGRGGAGAAGRRRPPAPAPKPGAGRRRITGRPGSWR